MKIRVTQKDIDTANARRKRHGRKWDMCADCLIGVAAKRTFKTQSIRCGYSTLSVDGETFLLPVVAEKNIRRFLDKKNIAPFEFDMRQML